MLACAVYEVSIQHERNAYSSYANCMLMVEDMTGRRRRTFIERREGRRRVREIMDRRMKVIWSFAGIFGRFVVVRF